MATPNTALEALLGQFGAGPLSGPDEEHQLRAALMADADRMALLNGMAASGQVRGFAIETANATLVGTYDRQAGVINLPAASFKDGDLEPVVGLQVLIADFSRKAWHDSNGQSRSVTQDMVDNLNATFNGSPVLAAQVKAAVALSHVQHFSLLDSGMAAGATYDGTVGDGTPKGINLPPAALQSWTPGNPQGTYDAQDLTFVLGHEIQHGFNDAEKDKATLDFLRDIAIQAKAPGPTHDYSDELRAYLGAGREDEAKAQIAGWNALLSRQRQFNQHADGIVLMLNTQNDRLLDFLRADPLNPSHAVVNPGITFNPDGSLSQTPANIAAMGRHYFDRPSPLHAQPGERPVTLGEGRPGPSADYTNLLRHLGGGADHRGRGSRQRAASRRAATDRHRHGRAGPARRPDRDGRPGPGHEPCAAPVPGYQPDAGEPRAFPPYPGCQHGARPPARPGRGPGTHRVQRRCGGRCVDRCAAGRRPRRVPIRAARFCPVARGATALGRGHRDRGGRPGARTRSRAFAATGPAALRRALACLSAFDLRPPLAT